MATSLATVCTSAGVTAQMATRAGTTTSSEHCGRCGSNFLATDHCSFFNDKLADAKSIFTERLYRSFGLAAHLGWARLLTDRFRDLVEIPAPTRQSPDGHRDFTPDDEDVSRYMRLTTTLILMAIRTSPIGERFCFALGASEIRRSDFPF